MQADCLISEANESFKAPSFWHTILGERRCISPLATFFVSFFFCFSASPLNVGHENAQNAATAAERK